MGCVATKPAKKKPAQEAKKKPAQAKKKKKAPAANLDKKARESIPLTPMKQDTVNDEVIEGMVKDGDLVYELQNQEMIQHPELKKCFKCKGTGKLVRRQRTIKEEINPIEFDMAGEYLEVAPQEVKITDGGDKLLEDKLADEESKPVKDVVVKPAPPLEKEDAYPVEGMICLGEEENCYMCKGSGETSQWLQSYAAPADVDDHPCGICFCDSKWGMSTDCQHFYCEECIKHSLEAMLNTGQFPAYCPQCRAESVKGTTAEPVHGRIEGRALSFLQQRGVITKEFQFRFIKQMREDVKEYFECPAMCGNFLIHQDPEMVFKGSEVTYKPGKCICGAHVCCRCHHLIEGKKQHYCPEALTKADSLIDPASLKLMENLGKPCPMCGWFCIKNGGCNTMMCGTNSHGKIAEALKRGGCGHQFFWDSLKPCATFYYNLKGTKVTGYTGDLRPGKGGIAAKSWKLAAAKHVGGPSAHPYWP